MPTEHSHIMGGSTAAQRINCPLSFSLEAQAPEEPPSEFADEGSMLHGGTELLVVAQPQTIADCEPLFDELEGQNMGYEGHEITREHIDHKLRPAMKAWFEVVAKYGLDDWFVEQRVSLDEIVPGAFGTADIIAKDAANRLHILDWKFGDGVPVSVKGNYGAGFYAGAALYDPDPELKEFTAEVSTVVLHIVQPRRGSHSNPLQTWETTVDWVEDLIDLAVEAREKALSDNPPGKPGAWCRFCKAKVICPEYEKMSGEALSKEPEVMTSVELAEALRKAKLLGVWIKAVFERAQLEMEKGAAVPNWKLVQKRASRQWIDAKVAEKVLKKNRTVKVADMYTKKLISPAAFEDAFPKLYSKLESELVQSHSSGLTVVEDDDPRPAVTGTMNLLANALPEQKQEP